MPTAPVRRFARAAALLVSPCTPFAASAAFDGPVTIGGPASAIGSPATADIDFNRDIRPILAANCFACHGFDAGARKAGLRLDTFEGATADLGEGVVAIAPGDLERSELWARITASDADDLMPPPESHRTLGEREIATIRAWIEAGAPYAKHWAFLAPEGRAPAGVAAGDTSGAIDAFIGARLAAEGLAFAPAADRATLARRVTLDLTGLPPSADEVAAFVADPRGDDEASAALVDRLLASPHYGERMALPWLDAARYADTNGFSIDGGRHAWLWRDWVIHSFNANKPYDRFLVEQLAGDLLPDRTDETLVATGFQRNAMVTHEGGTIAEENLVTYGADRVRTYGEAVLGLTLGCAQCHDHKYDPVTQEEYYRVFAYFNQTTENAYGGDGGVNAGPTANLKSVLATGEEDALRARIASLEAALAAPDAALVAAWDAEERAARARRGRDLALHPAKVLSMTTPNTGSGFRVEDGRFAVVERPMSFLAFDMALELPAGEAAIDAPITGLRIVMEPTPGADGATAADESLGWGGGVDGKRTFALTNVTVSAGTVPSPQVNLHREVRLAGATASSFADGARPEGVLDTIAAHAWSPDSAATGAAHITVRFAEPLDAREATFLTVQTNFGRYGDLTARRMRFLVVTGEDDGCAHPPAIEAILAKDAAARDGDERAALAAYAARHAPAFARLRTDLANARERLAVRTESHSALVMDTAPTPRETRILHRGDYASPRETVVSGTPAILPPLPEGAPPTRLALAEWTVSPANPLTARVAVNRVWQILFGTGIVRSVGDFGTQGEWPSHPELLDFLAVDFTAHGWDVKRLVRAIVLSRAYRQSSVASDALLARDPDNRLLARGPRFRLPAEFIRDAALKTGGLLVDEIGGPSVNPYTPGDPWREISHYGSSPATAQSFIQDHGDRLYRRSLYTYWKRTLPPPSMATFDAPNRETCTVDRAATNTPLQALVLLNDPQFIEAARAFAERIVARAPRDDARLAWAFAEATGRVPDARERAVLARALARERRAFAADGDAARRLLAIGESPRDATVDPVEHAAWTQVASLVLNLSESITRE
ncbi:MAG: hypothetical protein RI967_2041 [Planctomycetota bacterium]